jgi:lysophospholipid acyltransferase (LPLAT)-like uncharacterized protein
MGTPKKLGRGTRVLLSLGWPLYRAWMSTLRIRWDVHATAAERLGRGEPVIYAFWHEMLLPTPFTHRDLGLVVMVSRHRDGAIAAWVLERSGFGTMRGSTTRGGSSALRGMLSAAAAGHSLAITPDGPRGPRRTVQPGAVEIARRTGLPVLPGAIALSAARRFRSWDRMALPWPFTRVLMRCGDLLWFSDGCDTASESARLQGCLDEITAEAEERFDELWRAGVRQPPHRRLE